MSNNKPTTEKGLVDKRSTEQQAPGKDAPSTKNKAPAGKTKKNRTLMAPFALLISVTSLTLSVYIGWRGLGLEQNQPSLITGQEQLQSDITRQQAHLSEIAQTTESLPDNIARQQERVDRLLERVDALSQNVSELSGTSRFSWKLTEVEQLLRLANQKLLMSADTRSARALLSEADNLLKELDDYDLYSVREALAEDITALNQVSDFDQKGLYLRLDALSEKLLQEPLATTNVFTPKRESKPSTVTEANTETPTTAESWKTTVFRMMEQLWNNFTGLFRFNPHRAQPVTPLLSLEEEGLIRQNLLLMLEQSRLALLSGNQKIYQKSLEDAEQWVKQYFEPSTASTIELLDTLSKLSQINIRPKLPNINRGLQALKNIQIQDLVIPKPLEHELPRNKESVAPHKQVLPVLPAENQSTKEELPQESGQ